MNVKWHEAELARTETFIGRTELNLTVAILRSADHQQTEKRLMQNFHATLGIV